MVGIRTVEAANELRPSALSYQIAFITPNKFVMTCDDLFVCCLFVRVDDRGGGTPKKLARFGHPTAARILWKFDPPIPFAGPLGAGAKAPARYIQTGDCVRTSGKGAVAMTRRAAHTATLVVLLCLPVLALSDLAAWAKHHRMGPYFSQPCPGRCKSTRLSICSACMGGIKTCAQQHVCSNNRSVVCGDESTVSVPCWNQRYRW
jgi:hypothetical protein